MRQDSTQAYRSSMPAWAAVGSEVEVGGRLRGGARILCEPRAREELEYTFPGTNSIECQRAAKSKNTRFRARGTRTFSLTGKIRNRIIMHTSA